MTDSYPDNWHDNTNNWYPVADQFNVQVVASVYLCGTANDGSENITCGFIECDDGVLHLPCSSITNKQHAAEVAYELFKETVGVDPRTIDIVPYGFFDPMVPALGETQKKNRIIYLGYKTKIYPGIPVHPNLRFMNDEELSNARANQRIRRGHYEAYKAGRIG